MLGLCIFCLVAVILSARKLITGVSARVEQDIVEIPGLFSTKSIAIADIAGVDCKPIGFGEVSSITIVMIDGSRKYIGGANPSDASKFAEFIRLKFPASPTNPQAT